MRFLRFHFLFYILAFLIFIQGSFSQMPMCPPQFNSSDWSHSGVFYYDQLHPVGSRGLAYCSYWYRIIPGGSATEIVIDWLTLANRSEGLLTNEQLKGLIQLAITSGNLSGIAIGQTKEFDFIYQTNCNAYRWCYAQVHSQQEIVCQDPGWTPPDPEISTNGTTRFYRWGTLEYCGQKCCRKKVVVKKLNDNDRPDVEIVSIMTEDYPGSSCPNSTIEDCYFHSPSPCSSDCK